MDQSLRDIPQTNSRVINRAGMVSLLLSSCAYFTSVCARAHCACAAALPAVPPRRQSRMLDRFASTPLPRTCADQHRAGLLHYSRCRVRVFTRKTAAHHLCVCTIAACSDVSKATHFHRAFASKKADVGCLRMFAVSGSACASALRSW